MWGFENWVRTGTHELFHGFGLHHKNRRQNIAAQSNKSASYNITSKQLRSIKRNFKAKSRFGKK